MVEVVMAEAASPPASTERAIDLVHLARTTLGDRGLEREVLQLFDRQASLLIARMETGPLAALPTLAHTLKGSARGIGAKRVARAAQRVELAATVGETEAKAAIAVLRAETEETRSLIAELLRAH